MENDPKIEITEEKKYSAWALLFIAILTALLVYVATIITVTRTLTNHPELFGNWEKEESYSYSGDFKKLKKVMQIVERDYLNDYNEEDLEEGAIRGLLDALDDPYTAYYNKSETEAFLAETEGDYEGVGMYVSMDTNKNTAVVLLPIEGSPAYEAGVEAGDYIIEVDGVDVVGVSIDEVAGRLKGPSGTTVQVKFERVHESGEIEIIEKTLERRRVELTSFKYDILEDNIGYITFASFDENVTKKFNSAFNDLIKKNKVKGLIIDLRDNPGGVLSVATDVVDKLLPEGKIVYTVDKHGEEEVIYSDSDCVSIPIIVIVNENSASASEIMAAAIKDYGGTIVGKKSYGKGVVQEFKSLKDGTYIKITICEYFSPNGNKIHKIGVAPDVEVEDDKETTEDEQLNTAIEEMKKLIK